MLWVEGRNLMDGQSLWAPFEMVHAHWTIGGPPVSGCFSASTNGLASGNHILEATSHALCELIERDATALWRQYSATEQDRRRLDLATVDDAECLAVLDLFARAQIDVAVWDVTTDVGVPAFQCFAADRTGEIGHVGVGAGCHPTRKIALLRAATEAAQVRTTYIVGSREDIRHSDYGSATLAAKSDRARAMMRPVAEPRDFASVENFDFESLEAQVAWIVGRLQSAGIRQTIAVDLTRSEFGVPVVRVIAPGLEGFDHFPAYYAPGAARAGPARAPRMTMVVFVGPTLPPEDIAVCGDIVCLPPVAQGDIYRAAQGRPRAIGIIDGYFSGAPSVWHKEILWAISRGIPVFGSASMGALRAAELARLRHARGRPHLRGLSRRRARRRR